MNEKINRDYESRLRARGVNFTAVPVGDKRFYLVSLAKNDLERQAREVELVQSLVRAVYNEKPGNVEAGKVPRKLRRGIIDRDLSFLVTTPEQKEGTEEITELTVGGMIVEHGHSKIERKFLIGERVIKVSSWFVSEEVRSLQLASAMGERLLQMVKDRQIPIEAEVVPQTSLRLIESRFGRRKIEGKHMLALRVVKEDPFDWGSKMLVRIEPSGGARRR